MFKKLKKNLIPALTVSFITIPQSMSYALIAGLNPVYGIYTSVFGGFIGSLFGSSPYLITGANNMMAIITASTFSIFLQFSSKGSALFYFCLIAGFMQIFLSSFKFIEKHKEKIIDKDLMNGFLSGGALLIILGQFPLILGLKLPIGLNSMSKFQYIINHIYDLNLNTIILVFASVIVSYLIRQLNKNYPHQLLTILFMAFFSCIFSFKQNYNISIIENINIGIPKFNFTFVKSDFELIPLLLQNAFVVMILSSLEAISLGSSLSKLENIRLELLAQGSAKIASALFGGYPSSGSFIRTALNYTSGATSKISGCLSAIIVFIFCLFLSKFLSFVPISTLSVIIVMAAFKLIKIKEFKESYKQNRPTFYIMLITTVSIFILPSIFYGLIISIIATYIIRQKCIYKLI